VTEFHQILIILFSAVSLFSLLLCTFSVYYALKAWTASESLRQSTHTVTYTPIDKEIDKANQEWATKESSLNQQQKLFTEDIEDQMPEFASDDDDREVFSF
jgi:hypothetical protein